MFIPKSVINYVARKELGDKSNRPVKIIPKSDQSPKYIGHSSRWETRTGIPIRYPSAYRKLGWSSMRYRKSTVHIEVGKDWCVMKICKEHTEWVNKMITEL